MQYRLDIRALKAFCTSIIILVLSLGFVVPVQAVTYSDNSIQSMSIQSMEITDPACSKDNVEDHHHQVKTDCCDKQPCPQGMDCGIDCVAQKIGSTALLKEYLSDLKQTKSNVRAAIVTDASAYLTSFDAPPPRN